MSPTADALLLADALDALLLADALVVLEALAVEAELLGSGDGDPASGIVPDE